MTYGWVRDVGLSCIVPAVAVVFGAAAASLVRVDAGGGAGEVDAAGGAELRLALGVGLALALTQVVGMTLGFAGALRAGPVLALLVAALVAAIVVGRRSLAAVARDVPVGAAWAALLGPALLMATFPPWDRDEMIYHLALPRAFAQAGGYVRPDDNIFASLPLGWESIEAVLHALGGGPDRDPPFNPRLLGVWAAWGACMATSALARASGAGRLAPLAGVVLGLMPTFVEFAASAYVEPYLMLLTTLGLVAVLRVAAGRPGWWAVAGVAAGLAASVKYNGLCAGGLVVALSVMGAPGAGVQASGGGARGKLALRVGALAALLAAPFYVRNVIERGNPVFPMAYAIFEGEGWDATRAEAYWGTLRAYGAGETDVDAITAPLRVFFARDPLKGFEGSIGPLPLVGLMAAAPVVSRGAPARRAGAALLAAFFGVFVAFWALSVVQARFLLVALPPALALGALALAEAPARAHASVAAAALAAQIAWGASTLGYLWSRQPTSAWLAGRLTVDQALAQVLPTSYPASRALEADVPPGARVWLVGMRSYTYYLRRPYRVDCVFEDWRLANLVETSDDAQFVRLMQRDGVGFVLANERLFLRNGNVDTVPGRTARLRAKFEGFVASGALRVVWRRDDVTLYAVR